MAEDIVKEEAVLAVLDEFQGDCGLILAEVVRLRSQLAERDEALRDALDFMEKHSNRWDGEGSHPALIVERIRAAISPAHNGKD